MFLSSPGHHTSPWALEGHHISPTSGGLSDFTWHTIAEAEPSWSRKSYCRAHFPHSSTAHSTEASQGGFCPPHSHRGSGEEPDLTKIHRSARHLSRAYLVFSIGSLQYNHSSNIRMRTVARFPASKAFRICSMVLWSIFVRLFSMILSLKNLPPSVILVLSMSCAGKRKEREKALHSHSHTHTSCAPSCMLTTCISLLGLLWHKPGDLSNRNVLSCSILEVIKSKIKASAGLVPFEDYEPRSCSRALLLACRWPSPPCVCSHCLSSMCVCLWVQMSPFCEDTSHIGLGPTLMTSF